MKPKYLSALMCNYSGFKWCCSKEETPATTSPRATNTLQISKSRKAVLDRLSDLPESETNRELSFSFLINNGSTEINNSNIDDGVIQEEMPRGASAAVKEKKMRRCRRVSYSNSSSSDRMLGYLCAPVSFTRSCSTPRAEHENKKVNGVQEARLLACYPSGRRKEHQF